MSSLIAMKPSFPMCFCMCRDSNATKILFEIRWLLVKALWFSVIIFGKVHLSLLAKTFEKILYKTLQRLIGLKSYANSGFCFLWGESNKSMV